jgi:glycosyltransferase involved in cell wall biosynthesis
MLKLTVWMNMPSFYQSDLFKELVATGEVDLQVVYAKQLPADRLSLGWQQDLSGFAHHFLDGHRPIRDALRLARAQRDRLHIVNGIWAESAFAATLTVLLLNGSKYVIYSEAPNRTVSRAYSRRFAQWTFGRAVTQRATGLLPISYLAVDFFKQLGAKEAQLYPFGYFRATPRLSSGGLVEKHSDRIEAVFVGQLVRRKGLDLLIEAMHPLFNKYPNLFLTLIGGGEMQPELEKQIAAYGITERVLFAGTLNSSAIQARMAVADVVVLPSRWDGWGLVVNEAFSVGVPVILSDHCGASEIVRDGINGYVFRSEDVADLRRQFQQFLTDKDKWPELHTTSAAVGEKLSTESAAAYLITCLKHMTGALDVQPTPPWLLPVDHRELAVLK